VTFSTVSGIFAHTPRRRPPAAERRFWSFAVAANPIMHQNSKKQTSDQIRKVAAYVRSF
jgi:hypothetical protein